MQPLPMRQVFGETLAELGKDTPELVVLDCDCSSSTKTDIFCTAFPERFFNCGIAESNMVSIAAGFAVSGFIPVASTFAFLIALRAGDQVRSQIAHSRLNVKLAGGYGGLSDFADGSSHQSVADIAVMRALPNMTVIAPGDFGETQAAVRAAIAFNGPVYLRLSRAEVGSVIDCAEPFEIGKARVLKTGDDVTLFCTGTFVEQVVAAAERLRTHGISAQIVHVPTIKPLDVGTVRAAALKTGRAVTVEEHNIMGGLGSAIAETLAPLGKVPVMILGIEDRFGQSGKLNTLYEAYGLDAESIAAKTAGLIAQTTDRTTGGTACRTT